MTPVTALVVEDDPVIRQLISIALTDDGCSVIEASDGMSGLSEAERARPDVILLDIGLPDVDGLTVLRTLKTDDDLRAIPVVMVTAWADPEMVRRAMDRGAADYVCKPFAIDHLLERVDACLAPASTTAPAGDPATGLPGRDHLATVLERQAATALRTGRPFATILVDLDEVETLGATHGEAVVEDVLRALAKRLRQRAGISDVIARYDEHTLALVLPGADGHTARERAVELRDAIVSAPLDTPSAVVRATASFGIAVHETTEHPSDTLARAADALCLAMAAGGDALRADHGAHDTR